MFGGFYSSLNDLQYETMHLEHHEGEVVILQGIAQHLCKLLGLLHILNDDGYILEALDAGPHVLEYQ